MLHVCLASLKQEGRHPLTGQRAANFRLLANQWAERRLVTQWRHGCRAMRRSVCNAGASNAGRSLCAQPSANILIPLERQLIAIQPCCWEFFIKWNFAAEFSSCIVEIVQKTRNVGIFSKFWGSRGQRRTLVDGSLESSCRVLVKHNWTSFSISYGWGATRQNVSKLAAFRSGQVTLSQKFQGEGVVPGEYFLVSTKLDTFCYPTVQTAPCYVPPFWHNTGVWRTDGRTDRQTDSRNCCS